MKATPPVIIPRPPTVDPETAGTAVRLPPYLEWSCRLLSEYVSQELSMEARTRLSCLYPHPERGLEEEAAVHRRYNINTNFDVIEIGGEYDQAARSALNRAVQAFLESHVVESETLAQVEDILRLRDPGDVLVRSLGRPVQINWIDRDLSDEEFNAFADIENLKASFSQRDREWLTVFEYTDQRVGERHEYGPQRATKVRLTVFGVARGGAPPTIREVRDEAQKGALSAVRNRYRFELPRFTTPASITRAFPIVVISSRNFRGRHTPDLAAVVPELAEGLRLTKDPGDLLGYITDGEKVVRSVDWQEAFDQRRRRNEPRSVGFLLQIKRQMMARIADTWGIELWAYLSVLRTTDNYKPEYDMDWQEHSGVLRINLA